VLGIGVASHALADTLVGADLSCHPWVKMEHHQVVCLGGPLCDILVLDVRSVGFVARCTVRAKLVAHKF
jgi:hypothetical protein